MVWKDGVLLQPQVPDGAPPDPSWVNKVREGWNSLASSTMNARDFIPTDWRTTVNAAADFVDDPSLGRFGHLVREGFESVVREVVPGGGAIMDGVDLAEKALSNIASIVGF